MSIAHILWLQSTECISDGVNYCGLANFKLAQVVQGIVQLTVESLHGIAAGLTGIRMIGGL